MSEMPLDARVKLVIVTGLSGAGRTTTIRCLEDLGYETIDNLPISLVSRWLPQVCGAKIAIGLERAHVISRRKRFWTCWQSYLPQLVVVEVVFVTASNAILVRRFSKPDGAIHWPLRKRRTELTANAIC